MNPLSRQLLHASLLWRDHKGRYDQRLASDCRELLATSRPLSASWLDALRTLRKLSPDAADMLARAAGQPLRTTSVARLTFLLAYLLESGEVAAAARHFEQQRRRLQGLIGQNPTLCWLAHRDLPEDQQPALAQLLQRAAENRSAFEAWVANTEHRITLLGNGPVDEHPQLADDPDHLVIDFNQPVHHIPIPAGARHAWVRTTNGSVPPGTDRDLSWIILTGNNSLYQRLRFSSLLPDDFSADKYLFVPSPIWWELVAALEAPPSAGLIMLHWIATLRGGLDGVGMHGLSIVPGSHPLNQKPGRHCWQREREFLKRWPIGASS